MSMPQVSSSTYAGENGCDHDFDDHDLDPSSNDKEVLNSIEHVDSKSPDGSGGCSNHLTFSQHEDMPEKHSLGPPDAKPPLVDPSSSSPTLEAASPSAASSNTPLATTKGFGLKKWRRIRREITKDAIASVDSTKMLKRGYFLDGKQPGDGSASSTNALARSPDGAGSTYRLDIDTAFNAGVDSDNSEDRSSKSSTAASAPVRKHDASRAWGHQRDKHKTKSVTGRNSNTVGLRPHLGKGVADTSKKLRGTENISLEKENSLSSIESDSRSCNYGSARVASSVVSDQGKSGRPLNYGVEDSYSQPGLKERSAAVLQADSSINANLSEDNSVENSWNPNEGGSGNHQDSNGDPMINAIMMLQSAQVALEKEIQNFGEIGKGIRSLCDDSIENGVAPAFSMPLSPENCAKGAAGASGLEFNHVSWNENVQALENRLSEAENRLQQKELRILELEAIAKSRDPASEDTENTIKQRRERIREMEAELEGLFKQKVEAEVEYVAITRCAKDMGPLIRDQMKLLEEQNALAREQAQSVETIGRATSEAVMLQNRAEELENKYREVAEGGEIVKMQKHVVKITSCLSVQLVLLVLAFGLFVLQLLPKPAVVVPT